tara:strand:- start:520 stop:942 length:423 start_codon:yes stop_codon:yes gene_type:complete
MEQIEIINKKVIKNNNGDIVHILKKSDKNYKGFGELYISKIKKNKIKGWNYHKKMKMNLFVIKGKVKFVFFDNRKKSINYNKFQVFNVSDKIFKIIKVPPQIWFAFRGIGKESFILNTSNILHDTNEQIKKPLNYFEYRF